MTDRVVILKCKLCDAVERRPGRWIVGPHPRAELRWMIAGIGDEIHDCGNGKHGIMSVVGLEVRKGQP